MVTVDLLVTHVHHRPRSGLYQEKFISILATNEKKISSETSFDKLSAKIIHHRNFEYFS